MIKNLIAASGLFFGMFLGVPSYASKTIPEAPRNYIHDEAGVLGPDASQLSSILASEDQRFGNQILVAIFRSLDGEDHVDYTNRLFKAWNPGKKGLNNGLVIAAYLNEKKIRFEVGYGLEPYLTDAKSKRIIVETIGPAFREKQFGAGLIQAVQQVQGIIHQDPAFEAPVKKQKHKEYTWKQLGIIFIILLIFKILNRFQSNTISSTGVRRHYRNSGLSDGFFSSSSSSSHDRGSSSGGGFFGGGGSSGGGGASGDW